MLSASLNKTFLSHCSMCYPVGGVVHIKESLLLIGKRSPCGLTASFNQTFSSFLNNLKLCSITCVTYIFYATIVIFDRSLSTFLDEMYRLKGE